MATWDGSYQGGPHEDPTYCTYSQQSNQSSFMYYNNTNNNPTTSTSNFDQSITNNPDNSQCYFKNNRQHRDHHQSINNDQLRNLDSHSASASNLHPGATEFVPSLKPIDPSKIFFADNKNRSSNNRKYDNNKRGTNYQRQQDDYQRNSYRNTDKNRRGNNTYGNSAGDYKATAAAASSYEDEIVDNVQIKEGQGGRTPYRGRRGRGGGGGSGGRFQNDRYSNTQQFNNSTNGQVASYQNNEPLDQEKNSKIRTKQTKDYSDDPRDERYRKNVVNNWVETTDDDHRVKNDAKNKSRRQRKNDDPREESYRNNRRDYYDDKPSSSSSSSSMYKDKRNNYQDYNGHRNYLDNKNKKNDDQRDRATSIVKNESTDDKKNWRGKQQQQQQLRKNIKKFDLNDAASQKERLTEQLNRGQLECLVCCDYIRQNDSTWSCNNCYHVLHLKCIKKWAESSNGDNGWRCPACQNSNDNIPDNYLCFCGKRRDPEWNRHDTAHSCGDICGKLRTKNNCSHKCTLQCHPGSCPTCIAMVTRKCGCGKISQSLKCSTETQVICGDVCGKLLNCSNHYCEKICHHDDCGLCENKINQSCYCGKEKRQVTCQLETSTTYTCDKICNKLLDCKNHYCNDKCHSGDCSKCKLLPDFVNNCSCGQTPLTIKRDNCLDPVPTCDKICSKQFKCGQPSDPHKCKSLCHTDTCPQCELTTWVKCRCGNMDREIKCCDLTTKADDARCGKKCIKKKSCGKHKCNQYCCIDIEHICLLPCSKLLSCGKHKCDLTCHRSRCQPCYRSSFEELYCECGTAVIYPPVPCGAKKPTCTKPCTREHTCSHQVLHNCHSDTTCPPCTVLTSKYCYGKHELRNSVPCYFNELSCGLPCNKPISCGRHKCITLCHPGICEKPGQICVQPCTIGREMCGHVCAAPCHDGKCPDTPCKEMVKVTCTCGHRTMTRVCAENSKEFQRIASGILASKMADMQLGHSVDLEEVFGQGAKKQNQLKTLECNDECKLIERNRKLALGLQIVNPDLSGKLQPRYTAYMKGWAKKDAHFCQMVHDKLTELVQLAKNSKQKSRSYSFDSMNREKRAFVHESCEHFGCESQAYDQEPKRNVVATAVKDKVC